jgi:hypothetical protein
MHTVRTIVLIETTLAERGSGEGKESPVRILTQYWTPAGVPVAEIDPCAVSVTPEKWEDVWHIICSETPDYPRAATIFNRIRAAAGAITDLAKKT